MVMMTVMMLDMPTDRKIWETAITMTITLRFRTCLTIIAIKNYTTTTQDIHSHWENLMDVRFELFFGVLGVPHAGQSLTI